MITNIVALPTVVASSIFTYVCLTYLLPQRNQQISIANITIAELNRSTHSAFHSHNKNDNNNDPFHGEADVCGNKLKDSPLPKKDCSNLDWPDWGKKCPWPAKLSKENGSAYLKIPAPESNN